MAELRVNKKALLTDLNNQYKAYAFELGGLFTLSISKPKWNWPNPPTTRDIVDTGLLKSSQIGPTFLGQGNTFTYRWSVDYSLYVLRGYTTRSGNVFPARNWVRDGLKQAKSRAFQIEPSQLSNL